MKVARTADLHDDSRMRNGTRWVLLISLISGLLYALVYFMQRAIFLNGLVVNYAGVLLQGDPADGSRLLLESAGYYGATLALFVLYVWLLALCRRGRLHNTWARTLALLFPVLFNLGLLLGRPYLSIDIFSYMAHGYLGNLLGGNPYVQAARDAVATPFGPQLVAFGWRPVHGISPYGPLWTQFEVAVMGLTKHVPTAMLLIKMVVVAASLGSAALIWIILGRVRPRDQLLGTLVYLWNPMIIVEFAAEGHNDALMIFFVLAALALTVHARPAPAIVALMLGALAKYLPLILIPALLVYFWRIRQSWAQLVLQLLLGLAAGLCLAALLYRPLWIGLETFQGVRASGQPSFLASTSGALFWYLSRTYSTLEAAQLTSRILGSIFGIYLLIRSWNVYDATRLLKACAVIALVYLLVASPGYWPWYASMPLALMALSPHGIFRWMALVLSLCSRLVAPIDDIAANGFTSWDVEVWTTTAIGVTLPLVIWLVLSVWQWRRQRDRVQEEASSAHSSISSYNS